MVFKTLHWYILRELLRIFVLTASALTTLMAFGGTFRPFTKQGIEIMQLLTIMMNLMPAMLAYAIPIAALFAAVLVYWRLATDNELTACRASGISFVAIVLPALFLGLAVASVDLGFVNYVVPVFLERTERAVLSDIGGLVVSTIGRQENFRLNQFVIYADSASERPSDDPNKVVIALEGMAATTLKDNKPTRIITAREAIVTITSSPLQESDADVHFKFIDAYAFDEPRLRKATFDLDAFNGLNHITIPSPLKSKPKFLDISKLYAYRDDPANFPPVRDIIEKIAQTLQYQNVSAKMYEQWQNTSQHGANPLIFQVPGDIPGTTNELYIYAPAASLTSEQQLVFSGIPTDPAHHQAARPVRVDVYHGKKLLLVYTAGEAVVNVGADAYSTADVAIDLQLKNNVTGRDLVYNIPTVTPGATKDIPGVILPPAMTAPPPAQDDELLNLARNSPSMALRARSNEADVEIAKLQNTIKSELHSRGSFSVSCLTLVLLGAALGILLRGRNPLAVFVVGFVPAIFLVLLITAGRQMTESASSHSAHVGIGLIWAGNVILVVLVVSVYARLLRQ